MANASEAVFSLRLPVELYDQVKARAAKEDRSINALIRVAIRDYLEK